MPEPDLGGLIAGKDKTSFTPPSRNASLQTAVSGSAVPYKTSTQQTKPKKAAPAAAPAPAATASNVGKWKQALRDPRVKSGLMQMAVNMMAGQGLGQAAGGGMEAVGRAETKRTDAIESERVASVEERKLQIMEQNAATSARGVANAAGARTRAAEIAAQKAVIAAEDRERKIKGEETEAEQKLAKIAGENFDRAYELTESLVVEGDVLTGVEASGPTVAERLMLTEAIVGGADKAELFRQYQINPTGVLQKITEMKETLRTGGTTPTPASGATPEATPETPALTAGTPEAVVPPEEPASFETEKIANLAAAENARIEAETAAAQKVADDKAAVALLVDEEETRVATDPTLLKGKRRKSMEKAVDSIVAHLNKISSTKTFAEQMEWLESLNLDPTTKNALITKDEDRFRILLGQ